MLSHESGQAHTSNKIRLNGETQIEVVHNAGEDGTNKSMSMTTGFNRRKVYNFDQVFSPEHNQNDVYEGLGISNLITKVVEGYHATIFAYGQTGSGKSFTMEGNERENRGGVQSEANDIEAIGITQRGVMELFEQIEQAREQEKTKHVSVFCSFLQIYNEKVFDLLNPSSVGGLTALRKNGSGASGEGQSGLRIRWTKKDQFVVENLYVFECQSYQEALKLFKFGSQNKVLASHNLNEFSSRSHSIFSLTIETQDIKSHVNVTVSRLQLVDLAGSEKQSLTGTTGQ